MLAGCWLVTSISYLGVSDARRWQPHAIGLLSLLTATLTLLLAWQPGNRFAYRFSGMFAIGSLVMRCGSVLIGLLRSDDADTWWISGSAVSTTVMLAMAFWFFWLGDVKAWHARQRRAKT